MCDESDLVGGFQHQPEFGPAYDGGDATKMCTMYDVEIGMYRRNWAGLAILCWLSLCDGLLLNGEAV